MRSAFFFGEEAHFIASVNSSNRISVTRASSRCLPWGRGARSVRKRVIISGAALCAKHQILPGASAISAPRPRQTQSGFHVPYERSRFPSVPSAGPVCQAPASERLSQHPAVRATAASGAAWNPACLVVSLRPGRFLRAAHQRLLTPLTVPVRRQGGAGITCELLRNG